MVSNDDIIDFQAEILRNVETRHLQPNALSTEGEEKKFERS